MVGLVGNKAKEFERFIALGFIPMGRTGGYKNHVVLFHLHDVLSNANSRLTAQNILLVFNGIRVWGHAPTGLHDEPAHCEIGALVRGY